MLVRVLNLVLIGAVDQPEHGLQQVVAIGAAADHVQKQIELAWRGKPLKICTHRTFQSWIARRSSSPGYCRRMRVGIAAACAVS